MKDRFASARARFAAAAFEAPGRLDPAIKRAVGSGGDIPEVLRAYVDKVSRYAHRVVDEDIDALKAAGYDEDQIFELTVAAAFGAALYRFEAAMKAVRGEGAT